MKSQANGLLKVAEGVLKDYSLAYPTDKKDVARDLERLTLLTKERGQGLYLLDLPALDGALTQALESGRLTVNGALSKKASRTVHVPRLFRGLWLRIFDRCGNLLEDADPTALLFLRQLLCLGKKVEVECTPSRTKQVLKEYYHVEQASKLPTFSWGSDDLGSNDSCSFDDLFDRHSTSGRGDQLELWEIPEPSWKSPAFRAVLRRLQRNFDAFSRAIGTFDPEEFSSAIRTNSSGIGFRHGPGAVSDLTNKEYKYEFPTWSEKLGSVFPFSQYGSIGRSENERFRASSSSYHLWSEEVPEPLGSDEEGEEGSANVVFLIPELPDVETRESSSLEATLQRVRKGFDPLDRTSPDSTTPSLHEPASRLIAVPKTAKGPRLIAAEPTAHQWCQQFIKRFLEERLLGLFDTNFVSFKNQELSQRLVSKASLDQSLATVDLSSASDRLTCWVVERAFRKNQNLLKALHASRTRWTVDKVDRQSQPNYFINKKFASQGTAVTFPVQSIIFLVIALTASGFDAKRPEDFFCNGRVCNSIGRYSNKVRVFGDDIIIPKHGYALLCTILDALGLKVNMTKSFVKGHFRESCGLDSFKGVNVTPIKTKCIVATGPQSRQSLLDYANNLHLAGFWYAARAVESMIPDWVLANSPVIGLGCRGAGRISFVGTSLEHLRKRYSDKYQRPEYRLYAQRMRTRKRPTNTLSGVLQYFAEAPSPDTFWEHGVLERSKISDGLGWRAPYELGLTQQH